VLHRVCRVVLLILFLAAQVLAGPIEDIVSRVDQASYTHFLQDRLYTHSNDSRGLTGAQHDPARDNILSEFLSLGLTATLDRFLYGGVMYYNVVATKPGLANPSRVYVLGAHYDSISNDPLRQPGADDNASGVAGVLEAARVLSQYDFDATLTFIAFDREEQGLRGSTAYASAHRTDPIDAMVDLDMIAYNELWPENHDRAWVAWADDNTSLTQQLHDALLQYGVVPTDVDRSLGSDHVPFDDYGFRSAMIIEYAMMGFGHLNPYYHKATDTVDTANYIDYAYATRITRGVVGYLAGAAGLRQEQVIPEPCTVVLVGAGYLCIVRVVRRRRAG
jgi:hypothetical protein